jgi:uncharacterized membrane protein YphA (DoxX/SURF4 family)
MNEDVGKLLLRVGLGGVFLWFGIDKFVHPEIWLNYIPEWFPMLVSEGLFINLLGIVESLIGFFVLVGFYSQIAAGIAALMLVPIIFSLGYNELMVRDVGLFFLAVGIAVLGSGRYSLLGIHGGRKE